MAIMGRGHLCWLQLGTPHGASIGPPGMGVLGSEPRSWRSRCPHPGPLASQLQWKKTPLCRTWDSSL